MLTTPVKFIIPTFQVESRGIHISVFVLSYDRELRT